MTKTYLGTDEIKKARRALTAVELDLMDNVVDYDAAMSNAKEAEQATVDLQKRIAEDKVSNQ